MAVINYDWHDELYYLGACPEGLQYARPFGSYQGAWQACPNGSWLLWLYARMYVDEVLTERKLIMSTAHACVLQCLPYAMDSVPADVMSQIAAWLMTSDPKFPLNCMGVLDQSLAAANAAQNWAAVFVVTAVELLATYGYSYAPSAVCDAVANAHKAIRQATGQGPSPSFAVQVRTVFPYPPELPGTNI